MKREPENQSWDDTTIERGLKALAEERVAVPRDFNAGVMAKIRAEKAGSAAESFWSRLLPGRVLVPALGAAAALALVVMSVPFGDTGRQPRLAEKAGGQIAALPEDAPVIEPVSDQAKGDAIEKKDSALTDEPIETASAPAERTAEGIDERPMNAGAMPSRQPRSLKGFGEEPSASRAPVVARVPVQERASAASVDPLRPTPTAVATPVDVKGFSEVRGNVFRPDRGQAVEIRVSLEQTGPLKITVHDFNGRLVSQILDEQRPAGNFVFRWSGYDRGGQIAASGKYIVLVKTRDKVGRHKVALIR